MFHIFKEDVKTLPFLLAACLSLLLTPTARAQHAFLWDKTNGMQYLGSLGGNSYATGINDSGQISGYSYLADNVTYHPFIWTSTTGMVDLGTPAGTISAFAGGINSSGHIAGSAEYANGNRVAFFWSSSTGFVTIGVPSPYNYAYAINDRDEVTGQYLFGTTGDGFLWSSRRGLQDIGTIPGGTYTSGAAINNRHHIAGSADNSSGDRVGFLWDKTNGAREVASSPLGAFCTGLNDRDEIVGDSFAPRATYAAFYVSPEGDMTTLKSLAGFSTTAHAISQRGIIAGGSIPLTSGLQHAVIWKKAQSLPQDLGTFPGGITSVANALNNLGQVVGSSDGTVTP